jgi:hypothetical protein
MGEHNEGTMTVRQQFKWCGFGRKQEMTLLNILAVSIYFIIYMCLVVYTWWVFTTLPVVQL